MCKYVTEGGNCNETQTGGEMVKEYLWFMWLIVRAAIIFDIRLRFTIGAHYDVS